MADQSPRNPMPEQPADQRILNFDEVALGYTPELAAAEAQRCWQCKKQPCIAGCPVQVQIPQFIAQVAAGDIAGAYATIAATNSLPAICGRVCPQESQCEVVCSRAARGEAVAIGRLERYVADWHLQQPASAVGTTPTLEHSSTSQPSAVTASKPTTAWPLVAGSADPIMPRVAIVGAGPAALTCAGDLAKLGYDVTLLESFHTAGGVLVYGIPEFRLPKEIVAQEIQNLKTLGVNIETDTVVGRSVSLDELLGQDYQAVFIGSGAGLPTFLGIPGENLLGVFSANEYLTRINLMKAYRPDYDTPLIRFQHVAVIGAGNVAMDAARCARRLGSEVTVVYRRGRAEMPARLEEVEHAEAEGIHFCFLANPLMIQGDEKRRVTELVCQAMELGPEDASGRRRPQPKADAQFTLAVDAVIVAVGTQPNPLLAASTPDLAVNSQGCLITDAQGATTKPGVFAGGDAVTGSATVILA
ncbi:MAG: NADPH-dependent glutamate synthase, partial [Actinomycetia bacterium]|nr:NADPH-dependent glutamate synthase [Actinomycetes bacterium]